MKWLFPFDRFELVSAKSASEASDALLLNTAPVRLFRLKAPDAAFTGVVTSEGFKLSPVINYRNSFLPVIVGAYSPYHSGIRIGVYQRLPVAAMVFMALWLGLTWSIGGALAFSENGDWSARAFIFAMTAFAWALTAGAFWWEARHTKDELTAILDAGDHPSL